MDMVRRVFAAMKERKNRLITVGCAVIAVLGLYFLSYFLGLPKIELITPNQLAIADNETQISLRGKNFGKTPAVLVDGQEISGVTSDSKGQLSFELPASMLTLGERNVQVVTHGNGFIPRRSNIALLSIQTTVAQEGVGGKPLINSVLMEQSADTTATFTIRGENFDQNSTLFINDRVQPPVTWVDDKTLLAKISSPEFLLEKEFRLMVNTPYGYTLEYVVENENWADPAVARPINGDFVSKGYLVAHRTNSREAFIDNYNKGYRVLETDFQMTSDGVMVTLHNRETSRIGTYEEEMAAQENSTLLTFEELCELMVEYPDAYVVTDTKYYWEFRRIKEEFDYMEQVLEKFGPELYERFVVQVYTQEMFYYVYDQYDFRSFLYTLYASGDTDEEVVDFVVRTGMPAVTMPYNYVTQAFTDAVNATGAVLYTHTVNDSATANAQLFQGVYGLYTDELTYADLVPGELSRAETFAATGFGSLADGAAVAQYIEMESARQGYTLVLLQQTDVAQLPLEIRQALRDLQMENSGAACGYAVLKNGVVQQAGKLSKDGQQIVWGEEGPQFTLRLMREWPMLYVDEQSIDLGMPGIHVVSYDEELDQFTGTMSIEAIEENRFNMHAKGERLNAQRAFINYLKELQELGDDYAIMISVFDEASTQIGTVEQEMLHNLGLQEILQGAFGHSYAAVLNQGKVESEELSEQKVHLSGVVEGEWLVDIISGAAANTPECRIAVDGTNYAVGGRGINIVVFDKINGMVVDSVCFDTYENYRMTRLAGMPK